MTTRRKKTAAKTEQPEQPKGRPLRQIGESPTDFAERLAAHITDRDRRIRAEKQESTDGDES